MPIETELLLKGRLIVSNRAQVADESITVGRGRQPSI
jgi:hypothetical protein